MSLQNTPAAERVHIAFFGVRNAGKSSLVNAVTGQSLSIVSDIKGTTTDPVQKTMELLPIGPVVIIDTPGIDDTGALGEERVRRTKKILNKTDIAVLVVDAASGLSDADRELLALFEDKEIPYLIAANKVDLLPSQTEPPCAGSLSSIHFVSAATGAGIEELKEALGRLAGERTSERPLVRDLVQPGDLVFLVIPLDKSAPKGRLILPQQMVIRELLDVGAVPILTRNIEYPALLSRFASSGGGSSSRLVITDSQVFEQVAAATPPEIPLTSFSMLMARYKGGLEEAVKGAGKLDALQNGDTVLICEGCTHHRQCEDIGTVKMPAWLADYTKKELHFAFTSGGDFPEDLSPYALVIHCGGCMLHEKEMRFRYRQAGEENIPMTNYGIAIAKMNGILERCVRPLFSF